MFGKKIILFTILFCGLVLSKDLCAVSVILSQRYDEVFVWQNRTDSAFFATQIEYSRLVDYEAYETSWGRDVLTRIEAALRINRDAEPETLRLYRTAVLEGMAGTVLLKRNSLIRGVARMNESQRLWERLLESEYSDEANFALGLAEYYRITLLSRSPGSDRLNAVLARMRSAISKDNNIALNLSLSYIWVLQEQRLWDEAQGIIGRFLTKFPDNTMMLRAAQTIAADKENIPEIKRIARSLAEISLRRNPVNYSDLLSARRALIFAMDLAEERRAACLLAQETVAFSQIIDAESRRISWVRKHLEFIRRFAAGCR